MKDLPMLKMVGGKMFRLTVFKIHTEYEDRAPEDCTLIKDDTGVEIVGGEKFMICYVPVSMFGS